MGNFHFEESNFVPSQFEELIVGDKGKHKSGLVTILGLDGNPIIVLHGGGRGEHNKLDPVALEADYNPRMYARCKVDVQGDIKLYSKAHGPSDGVLAFSDDPATIHLDGEAGDIVLRNADCAEEFDIDTDAYETEPGTVMIVNEEGKLYPSEQAFDSRVVGIVSGAGDYKPGIVLDRQYSASKRLPIALVGKVFCKVDASFAPIKAGDLLTTSSTPGHAMRAGDPLKAFGAVLGKALRSLDAGQGLIPVLVTLQ